MRSYLLLLAIGLLWGSQFIFMHQAVAELAPILVAAGRALCGTLTLALLCLLLRLKSEHTPWRTYMLIALLDATLPFIMVAWGQQYVDSAIAAVVMGCIPFVTILMAPLLISGERITKSGRKELRWAMVEAAWRAVRMSPYWKEQYEKYLQRMRRPSQAIVVVARKLLVAVWHVLSKEETDVRASEEDLAYKMLLWSWSLSEEVRQGLTYKQFAKYALMRLGVQTDITRFVRGKVPRRIASKEEVLARMADLGLSG